MYHYRNDRGKKLTTEMNFLELEKILLQDTLDRNTSIHHYTITFINMFTSLKVITLMISDNNYEQTHIMNLSDYHI